MNIYVQVFVRMCVLNSFGGTYVYTTCMCISIPRGFYIYVYIYTDTCLGTELLGHIVNSTFGRITFGFDKTDTVEYYRM